MHVVLTRGKFDTYVDSRTVVELEDLLEAIDDWTMQYSMEWTTEPSRRSIQQFLTAPQQHSCVFSGEGADGKRYLLRVLKN